MKNYKKIYLRLKKDTQKQIELYKTYKKPMERSNFVEQLELEETINTLDHMFKTMEELEGKNNYGIQFSGDQFKLWKRKIKK